MSIKAMITRRKFVSGSAAIAAGSTVLRRLQGAEDTGVGRARPASAEAAADRHAEQQAFPPGQSGKDYTPVITPNGAPLPWKIVDGVKVFHLIPEPVTHEFAPGLIAECWGYNGRVHGPTIEAVEGDRVRIYVTNRLPAATSVHWHGVLLPNGMDGVAGLNQRPIEPGETFKYEFTLRQHGTHMYHSHHDEMTQMALGQMGLFIIHPRNPQTPRPDRDFAFMLNEWKIVVGTRRPDPNEMLDFNMFTFNARAFPGTDPLIVKLGERVRIRLANASPMSHHPIHLHGYQFEITQTDGGQIPESAQWPETTALTPVGSTRTFDFIADAPGDWALHCHMTHHVMNQMGHEFGNMIGVNTEGLNQKIRRFIPGYMAMGEDGMAEMGDMGMPNPPNSIPMLGGEGPFGYITMGGMFTILKVREGITTYDDPGWYNHPPGTLASEASLEELQRDGISTKALRPKAASVRPTVDVWCGTPSKSFAQARIK